MACTGKEDYNFLLKAGGNSSEQLKKYEQALKKLTARCRIYVSAYDRLNIEKIGPSNSEKGLEQYLIKPAKKEDEISKIDLFGTFKSAEITLDEGAYLEFDNYIFEIMFKNL
jgi:wyosine [tRNA(Phe)-imidazoG37] synthetase (radical SAM superfamily)